ncbi:MAG: MFS transporter [Chloroflexi bacterium]|nr:MFS transporter [Chloroflexota bacterium]
MTSNAASRRPLAVWARWREAILLGLATIGAYGTAYYAIGVLIPVIAADTGWGTGALSGGFAVGVVLSGAVALTSGRIFDRRGSRLVLFPGLMVGALAFLAASWASTPLQFMVAWAIGGAAIAGTACYNITMPMISRLYADRRAAALSVLTFFGAVASTIFYPLAGLMTEEWGWRGALRGLVVTMVLFVLPAALAVRAPAATAPAAGARSNLREALRDPAVTRALLMFVLMGLGSSALLLHQVAAMTAAGLTLALSSGMAGARGLFQLMGRLMLAPLIARFGLPRTMAICYAAAATSTVALLVAQGGASAVVLVAYFSVMGGMSLGLLSPLNGLFQAEVYGDRHLGTLTGVGTVAGSLASALGAWLAGVMADQTGSYAVSLAAVVALQLLALVVLG